MCCADRELRIPSFYGAHAEGGAMSGFNEKREFCATVCVARRGEKSVLIELSPAPIYGGPEGMFRIRIGRRWVNLPTGGKKFFTPESLATGPLLESLLGSAVTSPPAIPFDLPKDTRVTVCKWGTDDMPRYYPGWTVMPPIQGIDGKVYVAVTYDGKREFLPFDEIKIVGPQRVSQTHLYESEDP